MLCNLDQTLIQIGLITSNESILDHISQTALKTPKWRGYSLLYEISLAGLIPRSFRRSKSIFRRLQRVWFINFWWLSPLFKKGKKSDIETDRQNNKSTQYVSNSQCDFCLYGMRSQIWKFQFFQKVLYIVETVHLGILRKSTKYMLHDIHIFDKIEVMISWTLSK